MQRLRPDCRGLIAVLILSLIVPASARAETCFDQASRKLNPKSRITLHLTDGSAVKGRLEFLDTREKVLLLTAAGEENREPRTYAMSSIASLDYRAQSSNPGFAVAGGLLGIAAGAVIAGIASGSGSRTTNSVSVAVGGLLGGFVGILVGFALPASVTHDASISCADPSGN